MNKELLKQVIADNQLEIPNFKIIKRDFWFEDFGNYVFVGIRRSGKSFLLYQRMQQLLAQGVKWDEMLYLNFEDERLIGMTTEDLNLILEVHLEMYGKKPMLFLDEIQNISGWEKFARRLADSKHRVYITGSNAKMLSKDIQTTLGGRYIAVDVYPYHFKEFLSANNINFNQKMLLSTKGRADILRQFNSYFSFGGFPEGAMLPSKRDYLTSVYQKIFLGDIAARYSIGNTFALKILFKKIAESMQQSISFTRLANSVSATGAKIGTNTIINYIDYAKDAWLITSIQNIASKIVDKESNPKYYFVDNGILNLFLINGNAALLENLVAITLLRKYGRSDAVFFYNKNIEVDFYLPEIQLAIQVCYSLNDAETRKREITALLQMSKHIEVKKMMVVTKDEENMISENGAVIEVVPIWKWLLR
ncbi:MAG: ATP-binding protein [Chitinophagaceae bacterium]|jgi:predicted AAA+ superfamily ATPase|nr:ATP-binding protein [Chitinophagaceae bacterium]